MATKDAEVSTFTSSKNFVRESVEELKKVHAPTRPETIQATLVVFLMIFLFAVILGFFDLIWSFIMGYILG